MNQREEIFHSGTPQPYPGSPHGSGRYRKGSGEHPFQHQIDFRDRALQLKKQGYSDEEIMKKLSTPDHEIKSGEYRATLRIGRAAQRDINRRRVLTLKDKGYSNVAIGKQMGINESSVRDLLDPILAERSNRDMNTAKAIQKEVDEKGMIDVGKGVGLYIGASEEQMTAAIHILKQLGYNYYSNVYVPQATNPEVGNTTQKVLTRGDIPYKYVVRNMDKIGSLQTFTPDRGKTFGECKYPVSISSDRVKIRYAEDGGKKKDGVIELRPDVEDLSLGGKHYAQVRIAVDNSHYLKGMAMYGDPKKFPDGVDIIFNTNKHQGAPKMDVLKPFKTDPRTGEVDKTNPFGALLRAQGQPNYTGKDGKEHQSAINIVKQEGDWAEQARNVSSQMLSKQNIPLIKRQLALTYADYNSQFEELKTIPNPSVRQYLMKSFADKCDKAAAELKASAFPRMEKQVILPIDSLKDNEVYAPKYRDGELVGLVRYPHAGPFELPVLRVNNKNREASKYISKTAQDAVGINTHVAEILSGADFDGDDVYVIPVNSRIKLVNSQNKEAVKVAKRLEGFDPKEYYPEIPPIKDKNGKEIPQMKYMTKANTQTEMGKISNLITDMTLKGAPPDDISRAVKHSMVVIDAEKHKLNYQQSYIDNGIKELKIRWQGANAKGQPKGASTLISLAKSNARDAPKIQQNRYNINPKTGEKEYILDPRQTYIKDGKEIQRTNNRHLMDTVKDARVLSSGNPKETEYAKFANSMKSLANQARKEYISIQTPKKNPSAAKIYSEEISSLNSKLAQSLKNAPKERMAQRIANVQINDIIWGYKNNPNVEDLTKKEIKKLRQMTLANARAEVGASNSKIENITPREWEAIQSGAIAKTSLDRIIKSMDEDKLKELAIPKSSKSIPDFKKAKARAMAASGWTQREIADSLGLSVSSINSILNPKDK